MTTCYYDSLWRTVDDESARAANIVHHGMVNDKRGGLNDNWSKIVQDALSP